MDKPLVQSSRTSAGTGEMLRHLIKGTILQENFGSLVTGYGPHRRGVSQPIDGPTCSRSGGSSHAHIGSRYRQSSVSILEQQDGNYVFDSLYYLFADNRSLAAQDYYQDS